MKLWIISDLHLEFEPIGALVPPEDADVCVMAGDLMNSCEKGVLWLAENVGIDSVYVPGNHEFYGGYVLEGLEAGRRASAANPKVRFLENDSCVIGDVRFVGCALWTDFSLMGDRQAAMLHARARMNDYRLIAWRNNPEAWERFTPEKALEMHLSSRAFLEEALRVPFDGVTVTVTHHGPHPLSVHPDYENDLLNPAFSSNLTGIVDAGLTDLWVHGHTHNSIDYLIGTTRVVCNPRGYGNENRDFKRGLLVDTAELPRFIPAMEAH